MNHASKCFSLVKLRYQVVTSKNYSQKEVVTLFFSFQGAVTATFQALRNASPVAPTLGNITQSDLAQRRRKSRHKEGESKTLV